MTIRAQTPDSTIHEFPDGTPDSVIDGVMKSYVNPPSAWDNALGFLPHQAGLLANAATKGAAALPELIGNIPAFYANQARHAIEGVAGIQQQSPDVPYSHPFSQGADIIYGSNGQPQNAAERLEGDIVRPIAGVATGGAAAGDTAAGVQVPEVLGKGMGMQYASGVTGGAASGATREAGGSENEQLAAAILGGIAPSSGTFGVNMGKQMMRGSDANIADMQSQIDAFKQAGTSPSVGQATGGRGMQGFENILGKLPGSSGKMSKFGMNQQEALGDKANDIANSLNPNVTPEMAGRAIDTGLKESFLPSQRAIQGALANKLDSYIPPGTQIPVSNTTQTLDRLSAPIPGAPALSGTSLFGNSPIEQSAVALKSDMGGTPATQSKILDANGQPFTTPAVPPSTTMPYQAIKEMRQRVGAKLSGFTPFNSDIPKSELQQVYGGNSADVNAAAKAVGIDAQNTAQQLDAFTSNLHNEMDMMRPVVNQSTPEQIYRSALSGSQTGGTKLGLIMSSLPTQERETVAAQALKDLGKSTAANQNAEGNAFSGGSFMTRWNQLSPPAKQALFGEDSVGPQNAQAIDNLANVTSDIKEGTKILANPSGTAPAAGHMAALTEGLAAILSGKSGDIATLGGGLGTTRLLGHLLTNPDMVQGVANPKWSYMPNAVGTGNAMMQTGN